jgi:hypothetical protein
MTIGIVLLGLMAAGGVARVVFLNSEIKTLKVATQKFLDIAESVPSAGGKSATEIEEAKTEYEWIKNTTDLKKESRLIWLAGTVIILFVLFLSFYI